MFRMKVYRRGVEVLVAVSDAACVGETYKEGRLRLEVTEAFYGSEEASEADVLQNLRGCTVANLVGEAVVELAIEEGFVDEENVLRIEGVPHAQIALLRP